MCSNLDRHRWTFGAGAPKLLQHNSTAFLKRSPGYLFSPRWAARRVVGVHWDALHRRHPRRLRLPPARARWLCGLTLWPRIVLAPVPAQNGVAVRLATADLSSPSTSGDKNGGPAQLDGDDCVVELSGAGAVQWCDAETLCHERVHLVQQAECGLLPFYALYAGEFILRYAFATPSLAA